MDSVVPDHHHQRRQWPCCRGDMVARFLGSPGGLFLLIWTVNTLWHSTIDTGAAAVNSNSIHHHGSSRSAQALQDVVEQQPQVIGDNNSTLDELLFYPYANQEEMQSRRERFPSVPERVRRYMLDWYRPPCAAPGGDYVRYQRLPYSNQSSYFYEITEISSEDGQSPRTVAIGGKILAKPQSAIFLDHAELRRVAQQQQKPKTYQALRYYSLDVLDSALAIVLATPDDDNKWVVKAGGAATVPPILAQFGDGVVTRAETAHPLSGRYVYHLRMPLLMKARDALPRTQVVESSKSSGAKDDDELCVRGRRTPFFKRLQPILWLLNKERHFGTLKHVGRWDMPWEQKRDAAVFRGHLTGITKKDSHVESCLNTPRCKLVYQSWNSSIVDAKLTSMLNVLPEIIQGANMTGASVGVKELLQFKGLIFLEGNDVASGLKWGMLSNSVVLMPPPTITSWAMEELLVPWVHYIPLDPDLKDVEEKVQWMLDHPAGAQEISRRATLWILDLYYHPDAMLDKSEIEIEILRRYRAHFRPVTRPLNNNAVVWYFC